MLRMTPSPWQSRMARALCMLTLALGLALVAAACAETESVPEAQSDVEEDSIVEGAADLESETGLERQTDVEGDAIVESETGPDGGTNAQNEEILFTGSNERFYWGEATLDERIAKSQAIVRATFQSVAPAAQLSTRSNTYKGSMAFSFNVLEYLKGSGGTTVVAVAYEIDTGYDTSAAALERGRELVRERDTQWEGREALLFLYPLPDWLPSTTPADRYVFGDIDSHPPESRYSLASVHAKKWLPEALLTSPADSAGRTSQTSSEKYYLTDVPTTNDASKSSSNSRSPSNQREEPNLTLSALKTRIAGIEAEVAAGGGSDAYRTCIADKYFHERMEAYYLERDGVPSHHYQYTRYDPSIASGLAAGTRVHEHDLYWRIEAGWLDPPGPGELEEKIGGRDQALFAHQLPYRVVTARPLPAGTYQFYWGVRSTRLNLCVPEFPDKLLKAKEIFLAVTAPSGTIHEAFFDPVNLTPGVGFSATSGVLDPAAFSIGGTSTSITGLKWASNAVVMTLSPYVSLSGQTVDFIELDGSVGLSLSASSATANSTAGTLTWTVSEQPWEDGDQLMLRIGVPPPAISLNDLASSVDEGATDS